MADFGKINLAALPSHKIASFAVKGSKEQIECIILPLKKNHLFKSDKGNVYLDWVGFKLNTPQTDDEGAVTNTHLIKQSLPKEVRAQMSEEEKRQQPIIGNMNVFYGGTRAEKPAEEDTSIESPSGDDLPF